jgi:glutaredoxin
MHAEIIFYTANGCGFCVKAKQMLKDQIASGKIIMKDAKEAPKGVRGFPHFVGKNGKTHTGLPPSAEALMDKLGGTHPKSKTTPGLKPIPGFIGCRVDSDCKVNQKCVNNVCVTQNPMIYKPSLTTADIVGIVIASVAGVALIVALCFLIAKASKKGRKGKSRK